MNNDPSQDDWLDKLYANTKTEKPPYELDQKLLAQAKEQVPVKRTPLIFKWQRIVSVAAVLVFSVFIFFDVRDFKERDVMRESIDAQTAPQKAAPSQLESIPSEPLYLDKQKSEPSREMVSDGIDSTESADSMESGDNIGAVEAFSDAPEPELAPPVSHQSTARQSQQGERQLKRKERLSTEGQTGDFTGSEASLLTGDDVTASLVDEPLTEAENMILRIRSLLAAGDTEGAKTLLKALQAQYPEFEIPQDIIDRID